MPINLIFFPTHVLSSIFFQLTINYSKSVSLSQTNVHPPSTLVVEWNILSLPSSHTSSPPFCRSQPTKLSSTFILTTPSLYRHTATYVYFYKAIWVLRLHQNTVKINLSFKCYVRTCISLVCPSIYFPSHQHQNTYRDRVGLLQQIGLLNTRRCDFFAIWLESNSSPRCM